MVTVADLIRHRTRTESLVRRAASAKLPTTYGEFHVHVFDNQIDNQTHVALVCGDISSGKDVLVRVHSSCLTGDVLHSIRCDCGAQLDVAMQRIARRRARRAPVSQSGRPRHRHREQDSRLRAAGRRASTRSRRTSGSASRRISATTAWACRSCGSSASARCGCLSNNPRKLVGIEGYGLSVSEWLPLEIPASDSTRRYLKTKKEKLGHKLSSV